MAVIHQGVDRIIDSNSKTLQVGQAADTVAAVNDATTGLAAKAQAADVTNGLALKLDASAQAADSAKLGNMAPSHYATATSVASKLDATAQAADSAKLGGQAANYYAAANDVIQKLDATAQAADSAQLGGQAPSYYAVSAGLAATTDGDTALGWTGTAFKVVPAGGSTASVNDIGDVDTTGLQAGMVLMWNGSQWEPGALAAGPRTVQEATKTNGVLAGGAYCWFSGGWNDRSDVYGQSFTSSGIYGVMGGSQENRGHCSDGEYAYFCGGQGYGNAVGRSSYSSAGISQGWTNFGVHASNNNYSGTSNGSHAFWPGAAYYNGSGWPVKTAHADGAVAYHEVSVIGSNLSIENGSLPYGDSGTYLHHGVGNGVHMCMGDYYIVRTSMWDTGAATYHGHSTPNPGGGSDQTTNGELIIGFHGRDSGSSGRHNRTMTTSFTTPDAQWTSHSTYGTGTNASAVGTDGNYVQHHGGDYGSHRTSQGQRTQWSDLSSNVGWGGSARHCHYGNLVPNG